MQFYMTIRDKSEQLKFKAMPIIKAYINAANGYTVLTHKVGNTWRNTEAITGLLWSDGFKTLKEARADIDRVPRDTALQYIAKNIKYLQSTGYILANL